MKWGLKGGISIDADSGPPRYVLWCSGGICHQLLTFFQIGCGHTVVCDKISFFRFFIFFRSFHDWITRDTFMDWFIYKNKGSLFSLLFWVLWRYFHIWPCSTTITKTEFPKKVKSSQQMQPNRAEKKIKLNLSN